jgi:serine/threonine-protein phosphatase 2A regulatory subunit B
MYSQVMTGSYNNLFYIYDWENDVTTSIEANKNFPKSKIQTTTRGKKRPDINPDSIDFSKKCLHVAWHPSDDAIAIGASNNLFLYEKGVADEDDGDE